MSEDRIESRERVFEGVKFAVEKVKLRDEGGGQVDRELVVHPGAVVILGVLDDGRVVMIRNERFAVGKALWELPAGTLEAGEHPADCAARELAEETGYEASSVEPLCAFYSTPGICTEYMRAFVARGLRHVGQNLEAGEKIEAEPVEMDRLLAMIRGGEVEDGKTIAAVLHYHTFGV